ncbi:unnamed protein product [Hymenolepis diminuta]|uniref:Uncharacterized protein n=1 Tax=Hymenolepis diminuta TaxID=6216 RepID=A0A564Y2E7_HYMDI|nr:unnamed protein product [Hymenolepis diminuta]
MWMGDYGSVALVICIMVETMHKIVHTICPHRFTLGLNTNLFEQQHLKTKRLKPL